MGDVYLDFTCDVIMLLIILKIITSFSIVMSFYPTFIPLIICIVIRRVVFPNYLDVCWLYLGPFEVFS